MVDIKKIQKQDNFVQGFAVHESVSCQAVGIFSFLLEGEDNETCRGDVRCVCWSVAFL